MGVAFFILQQVQFSLATSRALELKTVCFIFMLLDQHAPFSWMLNFSNVIQYPVLSV